MTIKIFTTGGTIDKTYFDKKDEYHVGDPQAAEVFQRANVVVDYELVEVFRKDSLDINDDDRHLLKSKIEADQSSQIIVTHGTDSMAQTANFLGEISGKTIVFTGAMFPANYRDSDAVFNLGCALTAVQTLEQGTYLAINGRIFDPQKAVKNVAMNRFEER
jgi:L-asparaginase